MGSGKSTIANSFIKSFVVINELHKYQKLTYEQLEELENDDNYKPNKKMISIVSRQVLVEQHKENFDEIGINCSKYNDSYNYDETINDQLHLVTTIDSIHKLKPDYWEDCIIILDEWHSICEYLTHSGTLTGNRIIIKDKLDKLLKNTSNVLAMDADLNDSFFNYFFNLRNDNSRKCLLYHNTNQNIKDIILYFSKFILHFSHIFL